MNQVASGLITAICFISSIVFLYKTFQPEISGTVSGTAAAAQNLFSFVNPVLGICLAVIGVFFLYKVFKK